MPDSLGFQTKTDLIYERLCAAIFDGRIRPGERLNADALARDFGISKIPVREAILRLEAQGLAVQTPHSGAHVAPLSFREMRGIYLIRATLEGLATRLAAASITEQELADLFQLHSAMEAKVRDGALEPMSPLNQQFHSTIARAARYEVLQETIETNLLKVTRYRVGIQRPIGKWDQVLQEHARILETLRAQDADAAEAAARDHVERQYKVELDAQIDFTLFIDQPAPEGQL